MLTPSQLRVLRWVDENPSNQSEWLVNGKPAKGPPDKWNQFKISGPAGSIILAAEDMKALKGCFDHCMTPDKMYSLSDAGRLALSNGDRASG
jgi:hypothetical protein